MDSTTLEVRLRSLPAFQEHEINSQRYEYKDSTALILGEMTAADYVVIDKLLEYLHELKATVLISNNCFAIAEKAISDGVADGKFYCDEDAINLSSMTSNHAINYTLLPSRLFLAFDLTTTANFDRVNKDIDLLCIVSNNVDELLMNVGNIYGGVWEVNTEPAEFKP